MTVSGQFSCPPPGSFVAVYGQFLVSAVKLATAIWVHCFKTERLHGSIGRRHAGRVRGNTTEPDRPSVTGDGQAAAWRPRARRVTMSVTMHLPIWPPRCAVAAPPARRCSSPPGARPIARPHAGRRPTASAGPPSTSKRSSHATRRGRRDVSVYQCRDCDQPYLGQQWCPDCQRPCLRLGYGGNCPYCDEPVTIDRLLAAMMTSPETAERTHHLRERGGSVQRTGRQPGHPNERALSPHCHNTAASFPASRRSA